MPSRNLIKSHVPEITDGTRTLSSLLVTSPFVDHKSCSMNSHIYESTDNCIYLLLLPLKPCHNHCHLHLLPFLPSSPVRSPAHPTPDSVSRFTRLRISSLRVRFVFISLMLRLPHSCIIKRLESKARFETCESNTNLIPKLALVESSWGEVRREMG